MTPPRRVRAAMPVETPDWAPTSDAVVLVVDDDLEILRALEVGFRRNGIAVAPAASATEALVILEARTVGLILCDLNMPGMSGLELIRELRSRHASAPLPVIVMTGSPGDIALMPAFEAGADDFVTKPIKMDELVARTRAHLRAAATWTHVIEDEVLGRSAVVEALRKVPISAHPAQAALMMVEEIGRRGGLRQASLYEVTPDESLRGLASYTVETGARLGAAALVQSRATSLLGHARRGPWADLLDAPDRDEPRPDLWHPEVGIVAGVPVYADQELTGLLLTGAVQERGAVTPELQRAALLAASTDYATVISLRLGQALADGLHAGLDRRRFERIIANGLASIVFQPIVRLDLARTVGYEALSRFDDGERPDVRFAEAAAAGCGDEFELAAIALAVDTARTLPLGDYVSVNASPATVVRCRDRLRTIVGDAGRRIVIEVTEHAPIVDYDAFRLALAAIGAELAVDDAGAGFSSLRHIVELRPAFAKLDMSLVRDIQDDPVRQALVAGLVHYARSAGFDLVAEGIERVEEVSTLVALGVIHGQGYLLGRPEPLPES